MDSPKAQKKAVLDFRSTGKGLPAVSISKVQAHFAVERPLPDGLLVAKTVVRPPSDAEELLRSTVWTVFKQKSEGVEKLDSPEPAVPLQAEWLGVRDHIPKPLSAQSSLSEMKKFQRINSCMESEITIYYLIGGAWFRGGVAYARPLIKDLCKQSGGRAFVVQPRLAPQVTMPSIVLDALLGYFDLLSPAPGALHDPVHPRNIVIAGESAGAQLQMCIIQILQDMRRQILARGEQHPALLVNGRTVPIEMPAGCAITSIAADMTLSLPSFTTNASHDYLVGTKPWLERNFPEDTLWPTKPPRGDLFADNSVLCHPLVSVTTCVDWVGAPPMWIACGEEVHSDGIKFLVRSLIKSGVPTKFVEYEFMPHIFPMVLRKLPQSRHCMERWGKACRDMVARRISTSEAEFVRLGTLNVEKRDITKLLDISDEQLIHTMRSKRDYLAQFVWMGHKFGYSKI